MKKLKKILASEQVSSNVFISTIIISIALAIFIYFIIARYELDIENNVTGTVAIIASVPTAYLWIIKERKKEKELENKKIDLEYGNLQITLHKEEIYQSMVNELNKVYVDAVNQFYQPSSSLAGLFALAGLIDDWEDLLKLNPKNKNKIRTKIEQISSIIFTDTNWKNRSNYAEQEIYYRQLGDIVSKISKSIQNNMMENMSWDKYDLSNTIFKKNSISKNINLESANLENSSMEGIVLSYSNLSEIKLSNSDLTNAILDNTKMFKAELANAKLENAFLEKSYLVFSNLDEADFTGATLIKADMGDANMNQTQFISADLSNVKMNYVHASEANLSFAIITDANCYNSQFNDSTCVGAFFNNTNLNNSNFQKADMTNADLRDASLSKTNFNQIIADGMKVTISKLSDCDSISLNNIRKIKFYDDNNQEINSEKAVKELEETYLYGENHVKGVDIIKAFSKN